MTDFHIVAGSTADVPEMLHGARLAGLRFAGIVMPYGPGAADAERLAAAVEKLSLYEGIEASAGIELRSIPPSLIPEAASEARRAGASFVICRGEAVGEGIEPGTNLAAVEAEVDILAHPGLVDRELAEYAAEKGVALEFTSCARFALANARAASFARKYGCMLVRGSCACVPRDITHRLAWPAIAAGSESAEGESGWIMRMLRENEERLVRKVLRSKNGKK